MQIKFLKTGKNTSDATATSNDIIYPKTAYVNNEKIEGNILPSYAQMSSTFANSILAIPTDVSSLIGLSHDKEYLFVIKENQEHLTTGTIYIYKKNSNNVYELIKTYTQTELGITIGQYCFSVGAWGLFGDENKCLLTMKNNAYRSDVYSIVFDRSDNSIDASTLKTANNYNAWGWCLAHPSIPEIFVSSGEIYKRTTTGNVKLGTCGWQMKYISNFSCNGELAYAIDVNSNKTYFTGFTPEGARIKDNQTNATIAPNTEGNYAFVDGVLKRFNYDNSTGDFTYWDLENNITITANSRYIIWLSSRIYVALVNPSFSQGSILNLNVCRLADDYSSTSIVHQTTTIQSGDGSFKFIMEGLYGSGLIIPKNENAIEILDISSDEEVVSLIYQGKKMYRPYDTTGISSDILENKIFYNSNGRVAGTMPNNGALNYIPSKEEQIIPAGYTSGGSISACGLTMDEYENCLELVNNIEPKPYTELEFIQSTGTQWIDTGILGNDNMKVEIEVSDVLTHDSPILSASSVWENNRWIFTKLANKFYYYYTGLVGFIDSNLDILAKNKIVLYRGSVILNNNQIYSDTENRNLTNYSNLLIGATISQARSPQSMKVYYMKVWNEDELVRDFIPVKDADGVVCLYDKVTNTYFYNKGTGSFIGGLASFESKLNVILQEKNEKLLPENIRKGVTIFGVTGTYEGNTSLDEGGEV